MVEPLISLAMKSVIFWLSYLYFPVAAGLIWVTLTQRRWRLWAVLALVPLTLLAYARFIEPHRLVVAEHEIEVCGEGLPGTLKAAVLSDLHYGIFGNTVSLHRIIRRINAAEVDLVLIPGDFTYHLKEQKFSRAFAAFTDLDAPAYAVMGNHDIGFPGPDNSDSLAKALRDMGVTVLNPGAVTFSAEGKYLRIVGYKDYWEMQDRGMSVAPPEARGKMPTIFLQHNPDMVKDGSVGPYDLFVSGHTHGGQIYLPWLTCQMTLACDTLRYGYAETPTGKLFVTSGIGMVGLPMRLGVPPKIDMLTLKLDRCREDYFSRNPLLPGPINN